MVVPGRALRGLIVAPFGILPAHSGNTAHTAVHVRQLQEMGHELWYLGLGLTPGEAGPMAREWGDRFVHAPSSRWRSFLLRQMRRLRQPSVDAWYESPWARAAARLQERVGFDYVLVHYVFYTKLLEAFPENVRRIIDTHDVFANRHQRMTEASRGARIKRWFTCSPEEERRGLLRGQWIVAIQALEAETFGKAVEGRAKVVTVGHPGPWNPLPEAGVTVGCLSSESTPNRTGLTWFFEECWPRIHAEVPDAAFLLAGAICDKGGPWERMPGVRILGRVGTPSELHRQVTVEVNPVFFGTGLKVKSIEALSHGRPLVSASEGVAGLDRHHKAFVVADDPADFADAVVRLLRNPGERTALREGARQLLEAWNRRQQAALGSLFEGLPEREHR